MATEARGRVDTAINPVSSQIVAPVWVAAISSTLVSERWFKLAFRHMAVAAETFFMAHAADVGRLVGHLTMPCSEVGRMIEVFIYDIII